MDKLVLTHLTKVISRHLDSISAHYRVEDIELCLISCPADITALSLVQTYLYLGVEANVFRANYKSISSENKSFIAHIKKNDEDCFVYVQSASENLVIYYEGNDRKESTPVDFQAIWTGIIITASKTDQNKVYNSYNERDKYSPRIYLSILLLVVCSSLSISIANVLTTILDWAGTILCVGILYTLSPQHSIFDKFCIVNSRFDCQKLDIGKNITVLSKKNLALIGSAYFATRIFMAVLSSNDPIYSSFISNTLALGASVITICSVIYQVLIWRFCLLCLSVMVILLTEGFIAYSNISFPSILPYTIWTYILSSALLGCISTWIIESFFKSEHNCFSMRVNNLKIKRNQSIIRFFFRSDTVIKDDNNCFCIGDSKAPITITSFISPWCSKCKKVALQMIRLISIYPKYIKWNIYIESINVKQFETVNNVQLCLGRCLTSSLSEIDKLDLLTYWFKNRTEQKLIERCNSLDASVEHVKEMLIKQTDFVKGEKLVPRVWINGKVFPENYELEDLPFIILELCMINPQNQ